ncbi:MAG: HEAT repeat domain-containing protein [Anaerolineae bacterium]|nr:HEAT repeat domain-containing protein [Anaerolineae bacterium]
MSILNRLSVALNIRPGEGQLVMLLLVHSLFIGIAKVFTSAAASALFINAYSAQALPYVYIGVAVAVSLVGFVYTRLEEHLSFKALLVANLSMLLMGLGAFRLVLGLTGARWPTLALMIWFEMLWALTGLEFWGLASRLFNLRQGKRLFGLVGSGEVTATIISGFAMSYLVALIGTPNLLLVAAGGVAGSLGMLLYIAHLYHDQLAAPVDTLQRQRSQPAKEQKSYLDFFKNRYIVLIFALSATALLSYYVVDNAFFDRAQVRYTNADQLAAFIGNFLAMAGILSLVSRIFISGPFMERYGLLGGLLSLPTMVAIGAILVIIIGTGWGPIAFIFWLTTAAKLFDSSLRYSIYRSGGLVLYQPLPAQQQLQVQTAVESVVEPMAGGVAGILLLVLTNYLTFGAIQLYYILLVILVGWIILIFLLNRQYAVVLTQALTRRRLEGDLLALADGSSLAVLQQGLNSPHVGQVLYALDVLEEIEHESLDTFLRRALRHPAPEVRLEALRRIERRQATSALRAVRLVVTYEQVVLVRAAALRALAALGGADVVENVKPYLDDANPQIRQGALIGLLRSGGIEGVLIAGQQLLQAVAAPDSAERAFAAQVLGEVGISSFYQPLQNLLQNENVVVQRAALVAAGKLRAPQLWPLVIQALSTPNLSTAAFSALAAGGEAALPQVRAAFDRPGQSRQTLIRLARVCGRMRGNQVIALLRDKLDYPDRDVRLQVLKSLNGCGYRPEPEEAALIRDRLKQEVADTTWLLMSLTDLGEDEILKPLRRALHHELAQNQACLFLLLSFVHDSASILQAQEALRDSSAEKRAYALEVIDLLLPAELKAILLPLFDETISPQRRLEQLTAVFPQQKLGQSQRLVELSQPDNRLGDWITACALDAIAHLSLTEAAPVVSKALAAANPMVRETALWALIKLAPAGYWPPLTACNDPSPQVARVAQHLQAVRNGAKVTMLSTIEKVFALKAVDIFAETPEEALAEVASILEEVEVKSGETIFAKGEPGHSLYLIFEGRVRVHDDQQTLAELGNGDILGEIALFESELHSAAATALEDTRLLRLDQSPFYELLADRSEVAQGVIRVLGRRIHLLNQKLADSQGQLDQKREKPGKSRDVLLDGIMRKL